MDQVEFRPSGGFLVLAVVSPLVLVALGAWGWIRAGEVRFVPVVLVVLGAVLAAVAALDIPHRIVVDADGVTRCCLLRRQVFPWDEIVAFRRPQPWRGRRGVSSVASGLSVASGQRPVGDAGDGAAGPAAASGRGGLLVETVARRQYLLSFGRERPDTYGAIEEVVRRHAPGLSMPGPPYYGRAQGRL